MDMESFPQQASKSSAGSSPRLAQDIDVESNGISDKTMQRPLLTAARSHCRSRDAPPGASMRSLSFTALRLLACVVDLHASVMTLPSLAPSPTATAVFERLVEFVTHPTTFRFSEARTVGPISYSDVTTMLALPEVQHMQRDFHDHCSQGESLMEEHWARSIIHDGAKVKDFPYLQNYRDLASLEYNAVAGVGNRPRDVLFLGSGPLPLSSLLFAQDHMMPAAARDDSSWSIVNVDILQEANDLASAVTDKLASDCKSGMEYVTCDAKDAADHVDLARFDTVFLAALVLNAQGQDTKAKRIILQDIVPHLRPGALVVVRSANGLRELLYPRVDLRKLVHDNGGLPMQALAEVHPLNDIVNSIVIFRRT